MTASNILNGNVSADWTLLETQAASGNIELICKGTLNGELHGFLFQPVLATYRPDSTNLGSFTRAQLTSKTQSGDQLTVMGVPAGSGQRMGIDRNLDGMLDADTPPPRLEFSQKGTELVLSWPVEAAGFSLQSASSPDAASWKHENQPVQIVLGRNYVTNSASLAAKFFRLRFESP